MIKQGRITITIQDNGEIKAVAYPKNKDNKMYCLILEYLLNSEKCQEQIKKDIFNKLVRIYDIKHK
jgi:hypothetical protein